MRNKLRQGLCSLRTIVNQDSTTLLASFELKSFALPCTNNILYFSLNFKHKQTVSGIIGTRARGMHEP